LDNFYENGHPVKMFASVPGSTTAMFEQPPGDDTFQVGDEVRADSKPGEELLMRVAIGTGADARYTCRTDAEKKQNLDNPGSPGGGDSSPGGGGSTPATPTSGKASVPDPSRSQVRGNRVKVAVRCGGPLACTGALVLSNRRKVFGTAPFQLAVGETGKVTVKLNKRARKTLRRNNGAAKVKAVAKTDAGKASRNFTIRRS